MKDYFETDYFWSNKKKRSKWMYVFVTAFKLVAFFGISLTSMRFWYPPLSHTQQAVGVDLYWKTAIISAINCNNDNGDDKRFSEKKWRTVFLLYVRVCVCLRWTKIKKMALLCPQLNLLFPKQFIIYGFFSFTALPRSLIYCRFFLFRECEHGENESERKTKYTKTN